MTKKTKMWLLGGTVAAVAVGAGVYYYEKKKSAATTPSNPQLLPVNTFLRGRKYQFAAMLPANIADTAALENALAAAGWSEIHIDYFLGTGDKGSFPVNDRAYVASGTWTGADASGVPAGVVAIQL